MRSLLLVILLTATLPCLAQTCQVAGVITFQKGSMLPRADIKSSVLVIPKSAVSKFQYKDLVAFPSLAKSRQLYLQQVDAFGKRGGRRKAEELKIEPVVMDDKSYDTAFTKAEKAYRDIVKSGKAIMATVDLDGRYDLQNINCGDYYLLVNSGVRATKGNLSRYYTFGLLVFEAGVARVSTQFETL